MQRLELQAVSEDGILCIGYEPTPPPTLYPIPPISTLRQSSSKVSWHAASEMRRHRQRLSIVPEPSKLHCASNQHARLHADPCACGGGNLVHSAVIAVRKSSTFRGSPPASVFRRDLRRPHGGVACCTPGPNRVRVRTSEKGFRGETLSAAILTQLSLTPASQGSNPHATGVVPRGPVRA